MSFDAKLLEDVDKAMTIKDEFEKWFDAAYPFTSGYGHCYIYQHAQVKEFMLAAYQAGQDEELRQAAQAVVDRWDTPSWKDIPHTAEFIDRLRKTLVAEPDSQPGSNATT